MEDVLCILSISLQDRQGLPKIIGLLKEDRKIIFQNILFNYNASKILENYDE